ncbi:DUF3298 and DUF4163 domain-containing protein [Anaerovorax odorimutans]|uniref:DUF3298 and DUF4163 domain-containing protein n=1 Tax=Anaerovorax odorimutans TaxID=109327 RepID=UPI000419B3F7|nr:DUF3298 and DUF4163 domain-containing protein [Anaerovorax odorimutans]
MCESVVMVNSVVIENTMLYNDQVVLKYRIEYPQFTSISFQMALYMINKYYEKKALEYEEHCRMELFELVVKQYEYCIENNYPLPLYESIITYNITYNEACIISLYFDKYEFTGGAHGNTTRCSDTWNLQKYKRVKLNQLFTLNYKLYIFREIKNEIEQNPNIYFDDYSELILKNFNENNFYCTPEGVVIYYQQYDIAPYSSGIREFFISYSDFVMNPVKMCFHEFK